MPAAPHVVSERYQPRPRTTTACVTPAGSRVWEWEGSLLPETDVTAANRAWGRSGRIHGGVAFLGLKLGMRAEEVAAAVLSRSDLAAGAAMPHTMYGGARP